VDYLLPVRLYAMQTNKVTTHKLGERPMFDAEACKRSLDIATLTLLDAPDANLDIADLRMKDLN
jgi:hypothetical protein